MTTLDDLLDRAPVADITARARDFRPAVFAAAVLRFVLAVIAGGLYGLGWIVAKALAGLWFALAWVIAAVVTGWIEAGGPVRKRTEPSA